MDKSLIFDWTPLRCDMTLAPSYDWAIILIAFISTLCFSKKLNMAETMAVTSILPS